MADGLKMEQVQAAMKAMMDKAMETPNEPIAMCIVDAAGNLEAYAKMDNLRIFSLADGTPLNEPGDYVRRINTLLVELLSP